MTIRELIAKLQTMPFDSLVVLCDYGSGDYFHRDVDVRRVVYSDDKSGVQFMDHPEAGPMGPLGPVQGESVGWDDEDEDDRPHDLVSAVLLS